MTSTLTCRSCMLFLSNSLIIVIVQDQPVKNFFSDSEPRLVRVTGLGLTHTRYYKIMEIFSQKFLKEL